MNKISVCLITLFLFNLSFATTLVIPPEGDIVGVVEYAYPEPLETLGEVGLRHDIGYHEIVRANPHLDPRTPLPSNTRVRIPTQFILPKVPRHGIVINLTEYRLYFFPENDNVVMTYPIGIGRKGWDTPLGTTKVIAKEKNPIWRPSAKLRAHAAERGGILPESFPANKVNPLGKYALRLGWASYLIHGTNHAAGIGERISAGCIRMLPDDIENLFELVKIGTPVRVIAEKLQKK
jgi:L,D-transpeptidase ErfK/SrfK